VNLLKKIKGLFKKEYLSTLEIREIIVFKSQKEIRKYFNNGIKYPVKVRNINDMLLLYIIKERDPKAISVIESVYNDAFEYRVKYLRDRLKEIEK
jgi:hypothetical protein